MKNKKLGRGLDQLISGGASSSVAPSVPVRVAIVKSADAPGAAPASSSDDPRLANIEIAKIQRNPYQPRVDFNAEALRALTASIQEHGVMQPVVVREIPGGYQLIAGERRLRACKELGLAAIPAIVRPADQLKMLELALIENLQRADLNPIERAHAYLQLQQDFSLSQEAVATALGLSRQAVGNTLRLLGLHADIQRDIAANTLTEGHGKILLGVENVDLQRKIADVAKKEAVSVRELERRLPLLIQSFSGNAHATAKPRSAYVREMENRLQESLGVKVRIQSRGERGRIMIYFHDTESFEGLVERLGKK